MAPHYVPNFINEKYSNRLINGISYSDKISLLPCPCPAINGVPQNTQSALNEFSFLPFSPSSEIWTNEVLAWIKRFILEMADKTNGNSNHFSVTNTDSNAIEELLLGNEMIYPFNRATSYDKVTKDRWDSNTSNPLYPGNVTSFINGWQPFYNTVINNEVITSSTPNTVNNPLRNFRNNQLAYSIAYMFEAAKQQLAASLDTDSPKIGYSSKLVDYLFPRAYNATSGQLPTSISDEFCGYDEPNLSYLVNQSNKFLAIDSYYTSKYDLIGSFKATKSRTNPTNSLTPTRTIYLSEFNKNIGTTGTIQPMTATEIFNYGKKGFGLDLTTPYVDYNVRYYVFFAWNPRYNPNEPFYKITEGQQLGLYNLFNSIAPVVPQSFNNAATTINFEEEPKDYYNFSTVIPTVTPVSPFRFNKNNFASGAYTISNPSTYSNVSSLTISKDDVDWFKFTWSGKDYYLKVVQKSNLTEPDYLKQYGLKFEFSCTSLLSAFTTKANIVNAVEVDTKIFLYNADLVELASNDDYNGVKTFSKLYYNLAGSPLANTFVQNGLRGINPYSTDIPVSIIKQESDNLSIENNQFDVLVSPNPAVNYLDVSVVGFTEKFDILMTDLNGKTVYQEKNVSENKKTLDVSSINEGMYCLIISAENDKKVKKIIKLAK